MVCFHRLQREHWVFQEWISKRQLEQIASVPLILAWECPVAAQVSNLEAGNSSTSGVDLLGRFALANCGGII
jgi:hypothetical protein